MNTYVNGAAKNTKRVGGVRPALAAALLLALFACGCAANTNGAVVEKKSEAEIFAVTPIGYGVVSHLGAAAMANKELRKGDLAITVDLDDGRVVMLIQSEDNVYAVGDRVRVFRDGDGLVRAQLAE